MINQSYGHYPHADHGNDERQKIKITEKRDKKDFIPRMSVSHRAALNHRADVKYMPQAKIFSPSAHGGSFINSAMFQQMSFCTVLVR